MKTLLEIKEDYKNQLITRKNWILNRLPSVASEDEYEYYHAEIFNIDKELEK